jgi:hypothetical protein
VKSNRLGRIAIQFIYAALVARRMTYRPRISDVSAESQGYLDKAVSATWQRRLWAKLFGGRALPYGPALAVLVAVSLLLWAGLIYMVYWLLH